MGPFTYELAEDTLEGAVIWVSHSFVNQLIKSFN